MPDPRIIGGLLVFGALSTTPVWYGAARGRHGPPQLPRAQGQCVEAPAYMRTHHMQLLDRWRNTVVREGVRTYVSSDGHSVRMSLTGTCLKCHGDAGHFCNQCHQYAGVEITCFDCHKQERSTP